MSSTEGMSFFDVKERTRVDVPIDQVAATYYSRTTKEGQTQIRFALRGRYKGRNLTKFIGKGDYLQLIGHKEDSSGHIPKDVPLRLATKRDLQEAADSTALLGVTDRISELIRDLVCEPALLLVIDDRDFECLVAEILRKRGYDVQLTQKSRDGGIDIYASRIEPNGFRGLYFVQCKRQSLRNKVGVQPVRELYGVVCARNATGGIVITTSFFTSPAKEFQANVPKPHVVA
jgi:hypothetical protein